MNKWHVTYTDGWTEDISASSFGFDASGAWPNCFVFDGEENDQGLREIAAVIPIATVRSIVRLEERPLYWAETTTDEWLPSVF